MVPLKTLSTPTQEELNCFRVEAWIVFLLTMMIAGKLICLCLSELSKVFLQENSNSQRVE